MTEQLATDELDDDGPSGGGSPTGRAPIAPATATPLTTNVTEATADLPSASRRARRRARPKRISKWDRPPDPHDWRFFVGNLGKVLIATGLLMFGFVAYQLWGTGIETARAQSSLKNEFEQVIAENRASRPASEPTADPTDATAPATEVGDTPTATSEPVTQADGNGATTAQIDVFDQIVPVEQDIPPIFRGEPLALLEIPAIGRSDIVIPGVSLNDLKSGPGHYPETPLPGQMGNAAIAGHRTTYGAPFFDVDKLERGDELIVTMLTGDQFTYEVTFIEIVSAADYWVISNSDPNIAELTLTSCHPKYTARDRIVVHSVLNPAKSANVGVPTSPYQLEPEQDQTPIPGDDPVLEAEQPDDQPIAASDTPDGSPATTPTVAGDELSDSVDPELGAPQPEQLDGAITQSTGGDPEVGDAFSQGWFDDHAAFPQIALWGMVLTLISLAAYRISRRFRHDSIGFLVGIAPFLFALYFFFQNVNRLLPPGL